MRKKTLIFLFAFLALIITLPLGVRAYENLNQTKININSDETVDGNLYFSAQTVKINGQVNGDVIGIAQTVEINGRIEGDILMIAQDFKFTGEAVGNIRIIADQVNISGTIGRNLNVLAVKIFMAESSQVLWDGLIASSEADIRASINGNLYALANQLFLNAKVDKNVKLNIKDQANHPGNLSLGERVIIGGDLKYRAKEVAQISSDSIIKGEIVQKELSTKKPIEIAWSLIYKILSAVLIALVLVQLFKPELRLMTKDMLTRPGLNFVWGAVLIILFPLLIIILALTILGFKLALILAALWLIIVIVAKIITAFLLGRIIINHLIKKPKINYIWKMILGIVVCWSLFALPFIGAPLAFVATLWGAGAIYLQIKKVLIK